MVVNRTARRLHHKDVPPAHILLNLNVSLAIGEARHQRLAAVHAQKGADFIGKRLIGGPGEDLELIVPAGALRLALRFLVGRVLRLLFCHCRKSCHKSF